MNLPEKSDQEIIDIAKSIWENLVKSSNIKDYGGFTTVSYTHLTLPTTPYV